MAMGSHRGVKPVLKQKMACKFMNKMHFIELSYHFLFGHTIISPKLS